MSQVNTQVEVLLATYNGDLYLRQQIDSIFSQTYENLCVLARDDGSNDGTQALLARYEQQYPGRFRLCSDSGVSSGGAKENFARLMRESSASFIAFSDQDDVWLPDKITRSMTTMRELISHYGSHNPLLVFTDAQIVDSVLGRLHPSLWAQQGIDPSRVSNLKHLLPQNVVTGCTMLCNRALLELALDMPPGAFMHDRWMALLACIFGRAEPVRTPTMLYRQHGTNTVGAGPRRRFSMPRLWDETRRRSQWMITEQQAAALLQRFESRLPSRDSCLLHAFLAIRRHPSGLRRAADMIRGGFFTTGIRSNLDMLWFLMSSRSAE